MNKTAKLLNVRFSVLYLVSLLVLHSATSLLALNPASAATPYDDLLETTTSLTIESQDSNRTQDITYSYAAIMLDKCPSLYNSYMSALGGENGKLAIVQQNWSEYHPRKQVRIAWTTSVNATTQFNSPNPGAYRITVPVENTANIYMDNNGNITCADFGSTLNFPIAYSASSDPEYKLYLSSYPVDYSSYEGTPIENGAIVDGDNDGLSLIRELSQGTLDNMADYDGDGLSDYIESRWYPNRSSVFCGTSECAYPDPLKKDVYVEIDWMNDGTTSFKPTATQVGLVSDAFAAKDIHFHADTGQYGGGSLLSPYTAPLTMVKDPLVTDFFDLKDASFSAARKGVWRYMISGKNFASSPTSSGASFAGSDNIFVSNGLIRDNQSSFGYADLDTAIAGTMLHEIGHSLCLSADARYSYQNSACIFGGVDSGDATTNSYPLYNSSMNYYHQMGMVDYSTKPNLIGDHDDWSAIKAYMGDFTSWDYDTELSSGAGMLSRTAKSKLSVAITTETAKELRKKGLLKSGKVTWRHLEVERGKKAPSLPAL